MADKPSSGMRVGVAWYRESEWEKLRHLSADPEMLEETYDEWRGVYEDRIRQLRASGLVPEPVEVDLGELQAWRKLSRAASGFSRKDWVNVLRVWLTKCST